MTLSIAGADGSPTARTLIPEDVGPGGRQFASDGGSVKARDLGERSYAALTFYWPRLPRQVRVCGPVVAESAEAGAVDFRARGAGARAESPVERQSQPLGDLAERDAAVKESLARLEAEPDLVAPGWTLHSVRPESVEFWQDATRSGGTRGSRICETAPPGRSSCCGREPVRPRRRQPGPALPGGTTATGLAACSSTACVTEPIIRAGARRRRRWRPTTTSSAPFEAATRWPAASPGGT
jgi:hypothetical protein